MNQTFTVTPQEEATNTVSGTSPNANRGQRQYTVTGLDDTQDYVIALVPAVNVSTDADGVVSFEDDPNNGVADWTETEGVIEVVNGTSVTDTNGVVQGVSPVNGTITFTIDSEGEDEIVPVVFNDADSGTATGETAAPDLDLAADDTPTEEFAVGGVKNWLPAEAANTNPAGDEDVTRVNKADDWFITDADVLYEYDANDRFFIDANANGDCAATEEVTLTAFEGELSEGDVLIDADTVYQPEDSLPSTFCVEDAAPGTADVVATGDEGHADLVITEPAGFDDDDTIQVFRAVSTVDDATPADCSDDVYGTATQVATLTRADDEDANTATIEYTDTVDPAGSQDGCYQYYTVAVVDGEESEESTPDEAQVTADTTAPTLTSASPNDINDGVGTTNQVRYTFNEAVVVNDVTDFTVYPTAQSEFECTGVSYTANTAGTVITVTMDCTLNDAPNTSDVGYTAEVAAGGVEDLEGNENADETDDFDY